MMNTGFDPLLSQMYSQEAVDGSYLWYTPNGDYVEPQTSTEGLAYSYDSSTFFPQHSPPFLSQPLNDSYFAYDGSYTTGGDGWSYDATAGLSSYGFPTPVDPMTSQPMFPFAYIHNSSKAESM